MVFRQLIFMVMFLHSSTVFCCLDVAASLWASIHNGGENSSSMALHPGEPCMLPITTPDLKTGRACWRDSGIIAMGLMNHFHCTGWKSLGVPGCGHVLPYLVSRCSSSLISFLTLESWFGLVWDRISFSRLCWNSAVLSTRITGVSYHRTFLTRLKEHQNQYNWYHEQALFLKNKSPSFDARHYIWHSFNLAKKILSMAAHIGYSRAWEVEGGGLPWVPGQLELHRIFQPKAGEPLALGEPATMALLNGHDVKLLSKHWTSRLGLLSTLVREAFCSGQWSMQKHNWSKCWTRDCWVLNPEWDICVLPTFTIQKGCEENIRGKVL